MKKITRGFVASATLSMGLLGLGVSAASAAPSKAPSAQKGAFVCPGGVTGTFIINSGNSHAAQTWNVAHLTFDGGGAGIFVPTELDLTITTPGGTFMTHSVKGKARGSITCSISETAPGFSLTGEVTGNIVHNG
jgi:hypothetical protein